MDNQGYAREKLTIAIDILVSSLGPIRDRLQKAYLILQVLKADDFRDDKQRQLWSSIKEDLISNQASKSGRGYLMTPSKPWTIPKRRALPGAS